MKFATPLRMLVTMVGALALWAALAGLFDPTPGEPFAYTNHRGENVAINGHGLYFYDTVSSAAQMQGNDFVTLVVGLPLLAASSILTFRGSLRGRLLLIGTLGFFLYTYLSMATLAAYNNLFLVYVAAFSASLFAFVLSLMTIEVATLPAHFSAGFPRRLLLAVMAITGGFLLLAWLGRIGGPLLQGGTPALENTTTLVIQTLDLGVVVPLNLLAAVLLLRREAWGYLLASVAVLKGLTLGLGVSAMGINMALAGVPDSAVLVGIFLTVTVLNLIAAGLLLQSVKPSTTRSA